MSPGLGGRRGVPAPFAPPHRGRRGLRGRVKVGPDPSRPPPPHSSLCPRIVPRPFSTGRLCRSLPGLLAGGGSWGPPRCRGAGARGSPSSEGGEGGAAAARPGGPGGSRLCPCPWAPPDSGRARGSRRSRSRSPGGAGWRAGGPAPAEPPAAAGCHIQAPPRGVGPGRARGGREPLFGGAGPAGSRSRSGAGRWVGAGAPRDPRRGRAGWRGPGRG